MADTVLFQADGGLAWITLNRPEARNAINDELRQALLDALARVAADPAIRAAVLTGAGEGFCPGADLWGGRRDAPPPHAGMTRTLMKQNSQRLIRAVLELEKPLIAAVNGVAAGMGAHLALACDLVVMAAEARLDSSRCGQGRNLWFGPPRPPQGRPGVLFAAGQYGIDDSTTNPKPAAAGQGLLEMETWVGD